jgi:hypothetical protein
VEVLSGLPAFFDRVKVLDWKRRTSCKVLKLTIDALYTHAGW